MNRIDDRNIDLSYIIVCMNNLNNLFPCLNSIKKYEPRNYTYEVIVTAYLFSRKNLNLLKTNYPWVKIVESNQIRGFSENNNLALKNAKGKYAYIINDDTLQIDESITLLLDDIKKLPPNVAIVSPVLKGKDGSIQYCGRQSQNWFQYMLGYAHLWSDRTGSYTNKKGLFQSYNIIGAAFLIKLDLFKDVGYFDESFFFCPEDIALSTLLNKKGYLCYVDSNATIIHLEGMSSKSLSYVQTATHPAGNIGAIRFFSHNNILKRLILSLFVLIITLLIFFYHRLRGIISSRPNYFYILSIGEMNTICSIFSKSSTKDIFIKYYSKLQKR